MNSPLNVPASRIDQVLRHGSMVLLFLVPCLVPVTLKLWATLAVGLILLSVVSWLRLTPSARPLPDRSEAIALLGMLLFALILGGLDAMQGEKSGSAMRVMLALLLFPLVRSQRIGPDAFLLGCVAGACAAAGLGMWQHFVLGQERVIGTSYYNLYAAQALTVGLMPAVFWAASGQWRGWRRHLSGLALLAAAVAALLSGSRGAWVAAAIVAIWLAARTSWRKLGWALLLLWLLVGLATLFVPSFSQRWAIAVQDIEAYRAGMGTTSLGMRLDMWIAAWHGWLAHPLLGLGQEKFDAWLMLRADQGVTPRALADLHFSHAHNEILNTLVTTGVLGLLGWGSLQLGAWCCLRRIPALAGVASGAARGGQMLIVLFAALGLSDVMFYHHRMLTLYCLFLVILLAWSRPDNALLPPH